jgi:hypothetical protein
MDGASLQHCLRGWTSSMQGAAMEAIELESRNVDISKLVVCGIYINGMSLRAPNPPPVYRAGAT